MVFMMKKYLILLLFSLLMASAVVSAQEKNVDEIAPPIEYGLMPPKLPPDALALFDGRTLFGWTAKPVKPTAKAGTPKPKIEIKNGETRIETTVPVRLKTDLLLKRPWRMELTCHAEANTSAYIEIVAESNMYYKRYTYPLADTAESKTLVIEALGETGEAIRFGDSDVAAGGTVKDERTGAALVVQKGALTIDSLIFIPAWRPLFDGTLTGWTTLGDTNAAPSNDEGRAALRLTGGSGALESAEEFDDFYFSLDYKEIASPNNSGFFFRTIPHSKMDGYEAQLNNAPTEADRMKFLGNDTGSIFRRAAARRLVSDAGGWNRLTVMAEADLFRTWVNGVPALVWVDTREANENPRKGRRFKRGTIQLQGHDQTTDILFRDLCVADGLGSFAPPEPTISEDNAAFEVFRPFYKKFRIDGKSLTDWHIHLRGGMTPEKALEREHQTGMKSAVLENAGRDWPLSDDEKIMAFVDSVRAVSTDMPVGLQVNDRDWATVISPEVLKRLDFILADTMIMGVGDDGKPQKLWLLPKDYAADPIEWFDRYRAHCQQILNEPISILANPTYLPEFLADRYDELWTDDRMAEIIDKAVERGIALEIQAGSRFPSDRFVKMAIDKGATLSFGTNNFDATLKDLSRWQEVLEKYNAEKIK